jgi:RHS repeat-associated protein
MNGDCETGTILESWLFGYDGDGVRVSTAHFTGSTSDSLSLYYFGGSYEVTDGAAKKYYSFAGQTIAMKDDAGLKYLLTDHLGSIVTMLDSSGTVLSEQRYLPFGEVRVDLSSITQTDFGYTGQRALDMGLMDYKARFYSSALGRFIQPDTIIPGVDNPQSWNRFTYVRNSPIMNIDPTGHDDVPWWDIIKFLASRLINNHKITDTDWREAANTYLPAANEGSNFTVQASAVVTPGSGVVEANYVTTDDGDFQLFLTYGAGLGLGSPSVAVGYSQGAIIGKGFRTADDFEGTALQLSGGANLKELVGVAGDGWLGIKQSKTGGLELSNVYGYDISATIGTPGGSVALTVQRATPAQNVVYSLLTKSNLIRTRVGQAYDKYVRSVSSFRLDGFGLFVCRAMNQCGRPVIK